MAEETPGGRRIVVEPQEIAGSTSGWSRARTTSDEEQRTAMYITGITVARRGMRVVGVNVGTKQYTWYVWQEVAHGKSPELA